MRWGVDQARRGWAERERIANTRPLAALLKLLHRGRREPAGGQRVGPPGIPSAKTRRDKSMLRRARIDRTSRCEGRRVLGSAADKGARGCETPLLVPPVLAP
jgi:hypothetical protein